MSKKPYFKILTLTLIAALSVTVYAGCGNKKAGAPAATAAADNGKITDKPIELSVMMPGRPEGPISNDMPLVKAMSQKTGITFKWEQAPSDDKQYLEKFNILVASGDIPDIMIYTDKELLNRGGANGVFEELTPYISKYMPNVKKKMDERGIEKIVKTDDGKVFYLPRMTAVKTSNVQIIRQDWLDKLSLKAPTTADEMYTVLKAFKEKDPNGNGKADEIPFTNRGKLTSLTPFFESFGIYSKDAFFVEDGKVKYSYTDPRYKEGLAYVNKLYKEKLIDNEYATNDLNIWQSRLTNGTSGMTYDMFVRADFLNNILKKADPKGNFVGIAPLKDTKGKVQTKDQQNPVGQGTVVSSKSKYKVEIAKFLNWMYSDEGIMLTNFGVEGDTYQMANGQPQYTDKIMKNPDKTAQIMLYSEGWRDAWPYYTDIRYENAMGSDTQNKMRDELSKYIVPNYPTTLTFTDDERKVITAKLSQINTYYEEMANKFVMGTESLDKFDDFVKKMDQIGLQDVLKVEQSAYDRYSKR